MAFFVRLSGSRDDLDSQVDPVGAQTRTLRFAMDIFVYEWLLLVLIIKIIIINPISLLLCVLVQNI